MAFEQGRRAGKKGYLAKRGGNWKTWKRRWFVLQEHETLRLAYYTNEQEEEELGTIDLMRCSGVRAPEHDKDGHGHLLQILVQGRTYLLSAESAQQREDWFDMIEAALRRYSLGRAQMDDGPVRTGYLYKQGMRNKAWRKRFVVVQNDILSYYKKDKDTKPISSVNLSGCNAITWGTPSRRFPYVFEVATNTRVYVFAAMDEADRDEWMATMEECVPDQDSATATDGDAGTGATAPVSDDEDEDGDGALEVPETPLTHEPPAMLLPPPPAADVSSEIVTKQGFLVKQGDLRRGSKQRWFVLKGAVLAYQQSDTNKKPLGQILLASCTGLRAVDVTRKRAKAHSLELDTPGRVYVLTASSDKERDEWIAAIEDAIPEELMLDDDSQQSVASTEPMRSRSRTDATLDLGHAPEGEWSDDEYVMEEVDDDESAPPLSTTSSMVSRGGTGLTESLAAITVGDVVKSGYLKKEGGAIRTWKKRYFVLRGSTLMYFKSDKDRSPAGVIDLARCTSVDNRPAPSSAKGSWGFDIVTPERTFAIEADTEQLRAEWVAVTQPIVTQYNNGPARPAVGSDVMSKSGYLEKRGGTDSSKAWKRRYFVLMGLRLFYYNDEKKDRALGFADLRECRGIRFASASKYQRGAVFELCTSDRVFVLSAETDELRAEWMHALAERVPEADVVMDRHGGPGRGGITADAVKVGLLEKRVDQTSGITWVKRVFVLTREAQLLIFRADKDRDPIETVDLNSCTRVHEMTKHSIDRPFTFSISVKPRLFILATASSRDLYDWMDLIADAVPEDDGVAAAEREAAARAAAPVIQSYLYKRGESNKAFRRRWFVMRGNEVMYYKRKRDVQEVGTISLALLGDSASSVKPQLPLETPNGFAIVTPERTFYLGADTDALRQQWVDALCSYLAGRRGSNASSQ